MPKLLDQLVYCDTNDPLNGNNPGVQAAASSLTAEELKYWDPLLYPLVGADHPYGTLCYLVSGDRAALMHRGREVTNRKKPFVHVLIGRRDELTAKLALGSLDWSWDGAIRTQPEKILSKVAGHELESFLKAAKSGWSTVAEIGARPPEVDHLAVSIRDEGGPQRSHLSFEDLDSLSSLGDNKFVILSSQDPALADNRARAKQPIQVLARLLVLLDTSRLLSKEILSERIIGTGFSTHERRYRSGQVALPRWVFATAEDNDSAGLDRFAVDLRNVRGRPDEHKKKEEANKFGSDFWAALEEYVSKLAGPGGQVAGASSAIPAVPPPALTEEPPEPPGLSPEGPPEPEDTSTTWPPQAKAAGYGISGTIDTHDPDVAPAPPTNPNPTKGRVQSSGPANLPATIPPVEESGTQQPVEITQYSILAYGGTFYVPTDVVPFSESDYGATVSSHNGPAEFADLSDDALIDKLRELHVSHIGAMIDELRRRTAFRHRTNSEPPDVPADMTRIRARLIDTEFQAIYLNKYVNDPLITDLYHAICEFAVSDQPQGEVSLEVIEKFMSVLASNSVHQSEVSTGIYSPLTRAIVAALWPPQDDRPEIAIPHDFAHHATYFLGRARRSYLAIPVASAPRMEDTAEPPSGETGRFLSAKRDLVALLVVATVVIIASCIGYYV